MRLDECQWKTRCFALLEFNTTTTTCNDRQVVPELVNIWASKFLQNNPFTDNTERCGTWKLPLFLSNACVTLHPFSFPVGKTCTSKVWMLSSQQPCVVLRGFVSQEWLLWPEPSPSRSSETWPRSTSAQSFSPSATQPARPNALQSSVTPSLRCFATHIFTRPLVSALVCPVFAIEVNVSAVPFFHFRGTLWLGLNTVLLQCAAELLKCQHTNTIANKSVA